MDLVVSQVYCTTRRTWRLCYFKSLVAIPERHIGAALEHKRLVKNTCLRIPQITYTVRDTRADLERGGALKFFSNMIFFYYDIV